MEKKKVIPYFTITFMLLNILIFISMELIGDTKDADFMRQMGVVNPEEIGRGQLWRFFSAMFMHFGWSHLLYNLIMLGAIGKLLEDACGHIKFGVLYLCSGIIGSILSYAMMISFGEYDSISGGASCAIFGIAGALLWVVLQNNGYFEYISIGGISLIIVVIIVYGFVTAGIDTWGHLGGMVAGFFFSLFLYQKHAINVDFQHENLYT